VADSVDPRRQTVLAIIEGRTLLDGRFQDLRRIGTDGGSGTFSVLISAYDRVLKVRVALKFFDPSQRNTSDQYRWKAFQREAALLQRLVGEPDILQSVTPLSEFTEPFTSTSHGLSWPVPFAYYGAELASGDAGQAIVDGAWSAKQMLINFRAMCRGVQRLHKLGIVHRDLKPTNFLVMPDGTLRLSDFGTARCLVDNSPPIEDIYVFPPGDLRYTAPEMVACLHDVDARYAYLADIYSLGAILFEMFSGSQLNLHVFDHGTLAALNRSMNAVNRADRLRIYHEFVAAMADSHPLPSLSVLGSKAPQSILLSVDRLYMAMSAVDYRRRSLPFDTIFTKVNRLIFILDHEIAYREWRERRALTRQASERKRSNALMKYRAQTRSALC
jgi:serine/threonine protein kinase